MPTFVPYDVGVAAMNNTGSLYPELPVYDVVDYELDPTCSGSFVGVGPTNQFGNGFSFVDTTNEFQHFQNLNQYNISFDPVPYELIWLPQPPDEYVLEPTRFRKTYTFFRQRSRQRR